MPKDGPIYGKYYVSRTDGRDAIGGGDKEGAKYFVLDYTNDKFAQSALHWYALVCEKEYPLLANDIKDKLWELGYHLDGNETAT